jgi:DNA-binding MarR family transcriptional regulator
MAQSSPMKKIKLSGRELSVLRAIDFATGTKGQEIIDRTRLDPEDLTDMLNAFIELGFLEAEPYRERVPHEAMPETIFQINPGYSHDLSNAIRNRW